MDDAADRRAAPRKPAHLVAEVEVGGVVKGCGVSRDASTAGLLLLTDAELPPGQSVQLRIILPGEEKRRILTGTVARIEKIPLGQAIWRYRLGVRWIDPPSDLQQIVDELAERSISTPPQP